MYDRGYSCQLNSSFGIKKPILNTGRKIALVRNGGGCSFYDKVYNSEMDGADGVIIYDAIPFRDDENSGSMVTNVAIEKVNEIYSKQTL